MIVADSVYKYGFTRIFVSTGALLKMEFADMVTPWVKNTFNNVPAIK